MKPKGTDKTPSVHKARRRARIPDAATGLFYHSLTVTPVSKADFVYKKLIRFKPFMFSLRKHFLFLSYDDVRVCNFHKDASSVLTVSEIYPYYLPTPSLFTTEGESEI